MSITLGAFRQMKEFENDGSRRLYLSKSDGNWSLKVAGKTKRGAKMARNKAYYPENAFVLDQFELAILKDFDQSKHQDHRKPNVEAALHQLFRHHQGAVPLLQRDVKNIFAILDADQATLQMFLFLQSLADAISTDDRFVTLVKGAYLNKSGKAYAYFKDTIHPSTLAGVVFPPWTIIKGCWNLCKTVNKLDAAGITGSIATELDAPFARLLSNVLHANYDRISTGTAFTLPFKVVGFALSGGTLAGIPLLASPFVLHKFLPSWTGPVVKGTTKTFTWAYDVKTARPGVDWKATEMPLPVFFVRRDVHGSVEEFPEGGRDKAYSLLEAETVKALITHLSLPVGDSFWENFKARKTQRESSQVLSREEMEVDRLLYREEARLVFKSMLGSPCFEDCTVDYAKGLSANDCIFYVGMQQIPDYGDTYPSMTMAASQYHLVKQIKTEAKRGRITTRPVSFLRLLAIAIDLAKPHSDKKGEKTHSVYSPSEDRVHYYHPTQRRMYDDAYSPCNEPDCIPEYLVKPWTPYLPEAFTQDQFIKHYQFHYVAPPDIDDLKAEYRYKLHWRDDKEMPDCFICGKNLGTGSRHHCRICGRIVCSKDATELKMKNKKNNKIESTKICRHCAKVLEKKETGTNPEIRQVLDGRMYALRPGDVRIGEEWLINELKHLKDQLRK